jgi:hypothetical protein
MALAMRVPGADQHGIGTPAAAYTHNGRRSAAMAQSRTPRSARWPSRPRPAARPRGPRSAKRPHSATHPRDSHSAPRSHPAARPGAATSASRVYVHRDHDAIPPPLPRARQAFAPRAPHALIPVVTRTHALAPSPCRRAPLRRALCALPASRRSPCRLTPRAAARPPGPRPAGRLHAVRPLHSRRAAPARAELSALLPTCRRPTRVAPSH